MKVSIQREGSKKFVPVRSGDLKLVIIGVQMVFKTMNLGRVTKTVSVDREEIIKDCALGIFLFYVFIMLVTFLILF